MPRIEPIEPARQDTATDAKLAAPVAALEAAEHDESPSAGSAA